MRQALGSFRRRTVIAIVLVAPVTLVACRNDRAPRAEAYLVESQSADAIPRFDILELSFKHNGTYGNNFIDVDLRAEFTSPSGIQHEVKGFYFDGDMWKVRFRPDELGTWSYTYTFTSTRGFNKQGSATFRCVRSEEQGPIRRNPENPFRWVFANGKPYFPVGLEDCVYIRAGRLVKPEIDGEDRNHPGREISWDDYFAAYGQAGFNLFRFSQKNCSYSLVDDLDHYRIAEGIATDELLSLARKHGFQVMFGIFGIHANWTSDNRALRVFKRALNRIFGIRQEALWTPDDQELIGKEERFAQYCIARWGVYADFWELLNERKASDKWTTLMAEYVRSTDPDRKPISTSWEKPNLPAIDIDAPHWYEGESELNSDLRVEQQAAKWKQFGKPVIVGEQGNSGMNWDPLSAVRMRIRAWTALFQEISLVFWNTSWSKAGMHGGRYTPGGISNIYLGPEERRYIRVLQNFAARLDAGVRMVPVQVNSPTSVRAYGLSSKTMTAIYLQHATSHASLAEKVTVSFDCFSSSQTQFIGDWIDPASGQVLSQVSISLGRCTLLVPAFRVDIAFLMTPKSSRDNEQVFEMD
jgi:hypothetical protein